VASIQNRSGDLESRQIDFFINEHNRGHRVAIQNGVQSHLCRFLSDISEPHDTGTSTTQTVISY